MFGRSLLALAPLLAGCASTAEITQSPPTGQQAFIEACEDWDDWSKPAPPFKVYGNSYYVGTCGIAAILVAGDDGHILIDGASRDGGPLVEANIAKLGFKIEDVKILLHSHEHFDHIGGLAYVQRKSGARVIASQGSKKALETGQTQPDDPQYGMHNPFEPVTISRIVRSFDPVSIGKITLLPLETPGHTPGALSWSWWSCEGTDCKALTYADSLSAVSSETYRFTDHPEYVGDYRKSLEALAKQPCDILLTPHPSASDMLDRMSNGSLIGGTSCVDYADMIEKRLEARLAREAVEQ